MKHKTAELEGALLDAAVAKALGFPIESIGALVVAQVQPGPAEVFNPIDDWRQGGPIIERERIQVAPVLSLASTKWCASINFVGCHYGETPLIAAMRAYVASKLDEEVELP